MAVLSIINKAYQTLLGIITWGVMQLAEVWSKSVLHLRWHLFGLPLSLLMVQLFNQWKWNPSNFAIFGQLYLSFSSDYFSFPLSFYKDTIWVMNNSPLATAFCRMSFRGFLPSCPKTPLYTGIVSYVHTHKGQYCIVWTWLLWILWVLKERINVLSEVRQQSTRSTSKKLTFLKPTEVRAKIGQRAVGDSSQRYNVPWDLS